MDEKENQNPGEKAHNLICLPDSENATSKASSITDKVDMLARAKEQERSGSGKEIAESSLPTVREAEQVELPTIDRPILTHDLGSFEGFNFRTQSAIFPNHTAQEVVDWDHDKQGEAEFWPDGDHAGISLIFGKRDSVTGYEIAALDKLLEDLGGATEDNFVRIHLALDDGASIWDLTASAVEDQNAHLFFGDSFIDLRKQAALELFELYFPEEYQVWEKSLCDGLIFDEDRFLDSPSISTEECRLGKTKVLAVTFN